MTKFQLILTGIFGAFILIGVMVFAFSRSSAKAVTPIVLWGTVPQEVFHTAYDKTALAKDNTVSITYVEKNAATFDDDFLNALASGHGPDAVMLPQDEILKNQNKLFTIPFGTYSERDFRDTFAQEGELFLNQNGALAIPMLIDPLVMYWNRDIFTTKGLAKPPAFWDLFYNLSLALTVKDGALNITRSTVALGEFANISHAKDILAALLFQAGTPIVTLTNNTPTSVFTANFGLPVSPATSATTFYTEFSNPAKPYYSWNRSLPNSQDMFVSGDLAIYFGFASELNVLMQKNPNLNFDVAALPQSRTGAKTVTFGRSLALALVKNSLHLNAAYTAIAGLTSADSVSSFSQTLGMPPARLDLLANSPTKDPYAAVFYQSALQSQGWLDPDSTQTDALFQTLIETVTSGRATQESALSRAELQLQNILRTTK